jgi:hypothetical protein
MYKPYIFVSYSQLSIMAGYHKELTYAELLYPHKQSEHSSPALGGKYEYII